MGGINMFDQSEQIQDLIVALISAKKEMDMPSKSAKSNHGSYANIVDYIKVIEPKLLEYGLVFMQHISDNEKGIRLTSLLCHSSGQWIKSSFAVEPEDNASGRLNSLQEQGKAITYLKRYAASAIFFRAGDDDDNDGATSHVKPRNYERWIDKDKVSVIRSFIQKRGDSELEKKLCDHYKIENIYRLPESKYEEVLRVLQKDTP